MGDENKRREAGTAAVLSFVFTGVGQLYNGEIKKGLWLVTVATAGIILALLGALAIWMSMKYNFFSVQSSLVFITVLLLGGVLICWSGIYSIYDAYNSAGK